MSWSICRPTLLRELPRVVRPATYAPPRHYDFRVVGFLEQHRAGQSYRDLRFRVGQDSGDPGYGTVSLPAIIEFNDRNHVGDRTHERSDNRLYHDHVAVDHSLARGLEPSDIHGGAFVAGGNVGWEPFVATPLALPHQVLVLTRGVPPFAGIRVGQDAKLRVVNRYRHR